MAELVLDAVTVKAGPKFIARDAGFTVPAGGSTALIGESGAGKTSLALAVMGLWPGKVDGDIRLAGKSLSSLGKREYAELRGRDLVWMLQDPMKALNPVITAGGHLVELLRRRRGLARGEARAEALAWIDRVGLRPAEKVVRLFPYQLSGGMAQRVLIAMALACGPKLLIADEPFSALDGATLTEQTQLLRDARSQYGFSLLLITHNLNLALNLCSNVVVLKEGQVVEAGPIGSVFENPGTDYTRELVAASGVVVGNGDRDGDPLGALNTPVPPHDWSA